LIAQHRRGDGALALLAGLLLVSQGLTLPVIAGVTPISGHPISLALPDTGWTRPLDLAFVVPVVALVLRVPHGRLGIVGRGLVGVLAAALVATPVIEVALGSSAPTPGDGGVTVLALTSAAGVVAGALLRGGRVARQARVPLLVVTVGMLLAAALQVYGDTLSVDPTPPPWATVLGLEGPRDVATSAQRWSRSRSSPTPSGAPRPVPTSAGGWWLVPGSAAWTGSATRSAPGCWSRRSICCRQ
jgi:hypothetical protein